MLPCCRGSDPGTRTANFTSSQPTRTHGQSNNAPTRTGIVLRAGKPRRPFLALHPLTPIACRQGPEPDTPLGQVNLPARFASILTLRPSCRLPKNLRKQPFRRRSQMRMNQVWIGHNVRQFKPAVPGFWSRFSQRSCKINPRISDGLLMSALLYLDGLPSQASRLFATPFPPNKTPRSTFR